MTWIPPKSPYNLIQEQLWEDPWKIFVVCIFCNLTKRVQAEPIFWEVLKRWPTPQALMSANRADLIQLIKPIGLAERRSKALMQMSYDYIHKDLLLVEKLFLEENNKLDAVSVDYIQVDERGRHKKHLCAEKNPIACGIMFRKDLLYDIGLYDENFKAREEEELRIRFEKKYKIQNLCVPLYRYWIHDNNLTKNNMKMDFFKDKLTKKHG